MTGVTCACTEKRPEYSPGARFDSYEWLRSLAMMRRQSEYSGSLSLTWVERHCARDNSGLQ